MTRNNIAASSPEINKLISELNSLYEKRVKDIGSIKAGKDDISSSSRYSYHEDGGLYFKTVDAIIKKLEDLSKEDNFKDSALFKKCTDSQWQAKFKGNFYKKFIDRNKCTDDNGPEKSHTQFNEGIFENEGEGNLCYAESFAVAFLSILNLISKGQKLDSTDQLINLLKDLNKIIICRESNSENYTGASGSFLPGGFADLTIDDKFGPVEVTFTPVNAQKEIFFGENFQHEKLITKYFEDFLSVIKTLEGQMDKISIEISKLVNLIEFHTHLFNDGNGRAASLLGDYLSISLTGNMLPQTFSSCVNDASIIEGRKWINDFINNPEIPSTGNDFTAVMNKKGAEDFALKNPVSRFLYDILKLQEDIRDADYLLFDENNFDINKELYLTEHEHADDGFLLSNICHHDKYDQPFNLKILNDALKDKDLDLLSNKTIPERNDYIAEAYFQYMLDNDLSQLMLDQGNKNLFIHILEKDKDKSADSSLRNKALMKYAYLIYPENQEFEEYEVESPEPGVQKADGKTIITTPDNKRQRVD